MLLVIGIVLTLLAIAFLSISNIRVISSNTSTQTVLISDLKNQQIKAMTGDTEGRGTADNYGVKILSDRYVLFHGLSYNPSDSGNFVIPIDGRQTLTSTFQNGLIIFASNSGELINFTIGQNTVTIMDDDGESKVLHFNKYGTITQVDN